MRSKTKYCWLDFNAYVKEGTKFHDYTTEEHTVYLDVYDYLSSNRSNKNWEALKKFIDLLWYKYPEGPGRTQVEEFQRILNVIERAIDEEPKKRARTVWTYGILQFLASVLALFGAYFFLKEFL